VLIWLSTVIFVNQLGFGSIIPVQALYAKSFGVSQSAIGLSIAVYGLSRFLVNVPAGRLADRIGRRWTLVLGEVVTGVGNILCGTAGSFELFLLFRFMAGAGGAIMQTTGSIILADISTKANRGRTIAVYHGIFLFAVGVGPLPGGLLAEHVGLNAPFYAFGALGLLAAVLAFDKVPETKGQSERTPLAPGACPGTPEPFLWQTAPSALQPGGFRAGEPSVLHPILLPHGWHLWRGPSARCHEAGAQGG